MIDFHTSSAIERARHEAELELCLERNPVAALLGPRQCGKTTLARRLAAGRPATYFDLENPRDLARLSAPLLALEELEELVILDEIQRTSTRGSRPSRSRSCQGVSSAGRPEALRVSFSWSRRGLGMRAKECYNIVGTSLAFVPGVRT